jgi:hypothetical protein
MLGTYLCRSEGGLLDTNVDTSNTVRSFKYVPLLSAAGTSIGYLAPRPEKKEEAPVVDVEAKAVAAEPVPSPTPA